MVAVLSKAKCRRQSVMPRKGSIGSRQPMVSFSSRAVGAFSVKVETRNRIMVVRMTPQNPRKA